MIPEPFIHSPASRTCVRPDFQEEARLRVIECCWMSCPARQRGSAIHQRCWASVLGRLSSSRGMISRPLGSRPLLLGLLVQLVVEGHLESHEVHPESHRLSWWIVPDTILAESSVCLPRTDEINGATQLPHCVLLGRRDELCGEQSSQPSTESLLFFGWGSLASQYLYEPNTFALPRQLTGDKTSEPHVPAETILVGKSDSQCPDVTRCFSGGAFHS